MHKSLHLLLYCLNTIYRKGKGGIQSRWTVSKNLEQLDAQHSAPAHWTVCMYFIACYFETVIMNYFKWTVTLCILWMNFDEYKQHILTSKEKYFNFVFKYRKNLFPVIVGCQNKPFYYIVTGYHMRQTAYQNYMHSCQCKTFTTGENVHNCYSLLRV